MTPTVPSPTRGSALLLGAILAFCAFCFTPSARAEWRDYPGSAARDLHQGPDGTVWAATSGGLRSFDGRNWAAIATPLGDDLRRVMVDRAGALWVLSYGGVDRRVDGAWALPATLESLRSRQGRAILEDSRGDVWLGFVEGLARYRPQDDVLEWFTPENSGLGRANVEQIVEDGAGFLWFASGQAGGLSVLDPTRTTWRQEVVRPDGLARDSVETLGLGADGSLWCGRAVFGAGLSRRFPDGTWRHYTRADGLPSDSVLAIVGDGRGGAWFGTQDAGIAHFDGRTFRPERLTPDGTAIGGIRSLLREAAGVLWLGQTASGILRFDGVDWRSYGAVIPATGCPAPSTPPARTETVFARGSAFTLLEDRAGNLWFGSDESSVAALDSAGRWTAFSRAPGRPFADSVQVILEDRTGVLHFGSSRSGVVSFDRLGDRVEAATVAEGLAGDDVRVLVADATGDLWAGGPEGLARRSGGAWQVVPELAGRFIHAVVEAADGSLYVAADAGLLRVTPAPYVLETVDLAGRSFYLEQRPLVRRADGSLWVGLREGLFAVEGDSLVALAGPPTETLRTRVRGLSEDRSGRLWITTRDGAARLVGGSWEEYPSGSGSITGTPAGPVLVDDRDHAWIPSSTGLNRFDGRRWKLVTPLDGLASSQVDELREDGRGHLWFLGPCGATEHAPDRAAPQTLVDLAPDPIAARRDASFSFSAFGAEEVVEYSSRLDPTTDGEWSTWSTATSFSAGDLADGLHRFEVRARDAAGNVDPSPAVVPWSVDATPPPARIDAPANRAVVDSLVAIEGTTADARLRRWRLDAKPAAGRWDGDATELVAWAVEPRLAQVLATWDSRAVADGEYDLRVITQDELGLEAIGEVRVLVDNTAPFADVTSPRLITRQEGGEVFTPEGDARLYLQPGALDQDARVTLLGAPSPPASTPPLSSGAGAVRRWYEVAWPGAALLKPATLQLTPPGPRAPLAVHHYSAQEGWTRLGGTAIDTTGLSLAIDRDGGYAVVEENAAAPPGSATLSQLRFSPRLFSPGRNGASGAMSIAFALGQPATVDVRVHNRAGRLVSEVARGDFAAGDNLVTWDGRDRNGAFVPGGLYVVTVEALGDRLQNTIVVQP